MKQATSSEKTNTRSSERGARSDHAAGPAGAAVAPPSYGLDILDQPQFEEPVEYEAPEGALQRQTINFSAGSSPPEVPPDEAELPFPLQAKLKIGPVDDKYEREADRIADRVMRMPSMQQQTCACGQPAGADGMCAGCRQKQPGVQRAASETPSSNGSAPSIVHRVIPSAGEPLNGTARSFMEARFDRNFSDVRIHTGSRAAESARAVGARAYTVGQNIVFGSGQYAPDTNRGRHLLAHELTHVTQQSRQVKPYIQRQPAQNQTQRNQLCYDTSSPQPNPSAKNPELHPTYELWLSSFRDMATFTANDTVPGRTAANRFTVLGTRGRRFGDTTATAANEPVPVTGRARRGEEFIDHPTNRWVENCLPPNLRATAYQLPSDCADIAVILRHVWLAAHHRTETYRGWTVGDAAGNANQPRARALIRDVYSGNVAGMVNAYSDAQGAPLTNFNTVRNLLHPGDILVWEHRETFTRGGRVRSRRTGGHTQTIFEITRSGGNVSAINVLQGNQPIFSDAARDILQSQGARNTDPNSPAGRRLRNLPSRRIERSTAISRQNIQHPVTGEAVWGDVDSRRNDGSVEAFTILVAAGPPRAATRPGTRRIAGQRIRRISDWFDALRNASARRLPGVLEAALLEARSIIDGGGTVSTSDAAQLGRAAGENVWSRATSAVRRLLRARRQRSSALLRGDVGSRTHFERLHQLRAVIRALGGIHPAGYQGNPAAAAQVRTTFETIDQEFDFAARGGSTISFNRRVRRGGQLVKVLVTGFDPFSGSPPPEGDWNPAGAAALALDGQEVRLGGGDKAAVESVVYPVSFAQFRQGIVERVVQTSNADAILTVSLDPNVAANSPVQIEQFAVGVHNLRHLQTHRLLPVEPANPQNPAVVSEQRGVPGGGSAIIETTADLAGIAADTERRNRQGQVTVQRPTIGRDVTLRFATRQQAQQAVAALGLSQPVTGPQVVIRDPQAIRTIISSTSRISDSRGPTAAIQFSAGGRQFRATILRGPGGSFLSNEVAYRTQRALSQQGSGAVSFHTHVPPAAAGGRLIPQSGTQAARRSALWSARSTVDRLVTTLRRMVRAVGIRVVAQRQQSGGNTP